MKVYHFFAIVATGKEVGAIGGDKLRFRTYALRLRNRVLPNLGTVTKYFRKKPGFWAYAKSYSVII